MNAYDPHHVPQKIHALVGGKAVVISTDGQILVLRRSDKNKLRPGGYDFPGGGLEQGEQPIEGVRREIREETGLEVSTIKPIDIVSFFNKENDFVIVVGYLARVSISSITLSWEHDWYQWVSPEKVRTISFPERHTQFLNKALQESGLSS